MRRHERKKQRSGIDLQTKRLEPRLGRCFLSDDIHSDCGYHRQCLLPRRQEVSKEKGLTRPFLF